MNSLCLGAFDVVGEMKKCWTVMHPRVQPKVTRKVKRPRLGSSRASARGRSDAPMLEDETQSQLHLTTSPNFQIWMFSTRNRHRLNCVLHCRPNSSVSVVIGMDGTSGVQDLLLEYINTVILILKAATTKSRSRFESVATPGTRSPSRTAGS